MARVADELGLMVWEEVPVYWTIQWDNPDTLANARAQLTEMIARDRNRASVIVWSVANETPVSEPRTRFLQDAGRVRASARPDAPGLRRARGARRSADADHRIVDDPFGAYIDLLSFNQYVGWYDGLPDKLPRIRGRSATTSRSSSASSARTRCRADTATATRFSEEYQETCTARRSPCCSSSRTGAA